MKKPISTQRRGGAESRNDHEAVKFRGKLIPVLGTVGGTKKQSAETAANIYRYFAGHKAKQPVMRELSRAELVIALEQSLRLQRHYAHLLNLWDGGQRIEFNSVEAWVARLRETKTLPGK